jgi:hypothetical protein
MNKTAVIIGSVALLGVGAYFYFKPKSIGTTGSETTGTGTTGAGTTGGTSTGATETSGAGTTSVPPTGTVLTTPEQVAETAKKIADAKDLATKISDLRTKRTKYLMLPLSEYARESGNSFWANNQDMLSSLRNSDITAIDKQIKNLNEEIGKLGYMEVNGSITKIV